MFTDLSELLEIGIWAPDLPGHGQEPPVQTWQDAVVRVAEAIRPVAPLPLLGYSQGGRVALGVAAHDPAVVSHLVLVSTSPGIEDARDRAVRRKRDHTLADHIERVGTDRFVDEWVSLSMFAGVQERNREWKDRDLALRRTNRSEGLAGALRAYGTGSMPYLGDELAGLACPVTIIVGADDEPYRERSFTMAQQAGARLHVFGGAGHAIIAEAPLQLADVLRELI